MPVLITADLHLDQWLGEGRDPFAALPREILGTLDALIIAGDLADKPKIRWPRMLRHLGRHVDPARIYVFPGNHDYYHHVIDGDDRLAELTAQAGANFAQKAEIAVGNTRFLCCTLWTDFALHGSPAAAMAFARTRMNDYRYIRKTPRYGKIQPSDTVLVHGDHRRWLGDQLGTPFAGKTVVVTHHCPHPELLSDTPTEFDPIYGSDLRALITKHNPETWLFGHTHRQREAVEGDTIVRNVSLGYPSEVEAGQEADLLMRGMIDV